MFADEVLRLRGLAPRCRCSDCLRLTITKAERVLDLDDLRADHGSAEVLGSAGTVPAPIAVASIPGWAADYQEVLGGVVREANARSSWAASLQIPGPRAC